jgi:hypothetical protein
VRQFQYGRVEAIKVETLQVVRPAALATERLKLMLSKRGAPDQTLQRGGAAFGWHERWHAVPWVEGIGIGSPASRPEEELEPFDKTR